MPVNSDPKPSPSQINSDIKAETSKGLDLSVTQIVGGALAAMTAAALGSRLSVAGTVVGAAVASIIAGVAGALYTASLRHTRDRVRSVWTGKASGTPAKVEVVTGWPETPDAAAAPPAPPRSVSRRPRVIWRRIVVGAIATFALTAAVLTGFELLSGQALSGGTGTTFEQVREPQPGAGVDTPEPSESASDEPSETPGSEDSPSETPEASTETRTGPSTEPSTEPSVDAPSEASTPAAAPSESTTATPSTENQPTTDPGNG
jgi:hypothetical protein